MSAKNAQSPKLLDQFRNKLRVLHYAWRTEQSYVMWIERFLRYHRDQNGGVIPHRPEVVVGSSRERAVAMNLHTDQAQLVLFCPAWRSCETGNKFRPDSVTLHSRADDVIPFADSEELA